MVTDGSCGILNWLAGRLSSIMSLSNVVVVDCNNDDGSDGNPLLWSTYFILFGRLRNTYDNASIAFWLASCDDKVCSVSSPGVSGVRSCLSCST